MADTKDRSEIEAYLDRLEEEKEQQLLREEKEKELDKISDKDAPEDAKQEEDLGGIDRSDRGAVNEEDIEEEVEKKAEDAEDLGESEILSEDAFNEKIEEEREKRAKELRDSQKSKPATSTPYDNAAGPDIGYGQSFTAAATDAAGLGTGEGINLGENIDLGDSALDELTGVGGQLGSQLKDANNGESDEQKKQDNAKAVQKTVTDMMKDGKIDPEIFMHGYDIEARARAEQELTESTVEIDGVEIRLDNSIQSNASTEKTAAARGYDTTNAAGNAASDGSATTSPGLDTPGMERDLRAQNEFQYQPKEKEIPDADTVNVDGAEIRLDKKAPRRGLRLRDRIRSRGSKGIEVQNKGGVNIDGQSVRLDKNLKTNRDISQSKGIGTKTEKAAEESAKTASKNTVNLYGVPVRLDKPSAKKPGTNIISESEKKGKQSRPYNANQRNVYGANEYNITQQTGSGKLSGITSAGVDSGKVHEAPNSAAKRLQELNSNAGYRGVANNRFMNPNANMAAKQAEAAENASEKAKLYKPGIGTTPGTSQAPSAYGAGARASTPLRVGGTAATPGTGASAMASAPGTGAGAAATAAKTAAGASAYLKGAVAAGAIAGVFASDKAVVKASGKVFANGQVPTSGVSGAGGLTNAGAAILGSAGKPGLDNPNEIAAGLKKVAHNPSVTRTIKGPGISTKVSAGELAAHMNARKDVMRAANGEMKKIGLGFNPGDIEKRSLKAKRAALMNRNLNGVKDLKNAKIGVSEIGGMGKKIGKKGILANNLANKKKTGALVRNFHLKRGAALPGTKAAAAGAGSGATGFGGWFGAGGGMTAKLAVVFKSVGVKAMSFAAISAIGVGALGGGIGAGSKSGQKTINNQWHPFPATIHTTWDDPDTPVYTQNVLDKMNIRLDCYEKVILQEEIEPEGEHADAMSNLHEFRIDEVYLEGEPLDPEAFTVYHEEDKINIAEFEVEYEYTGVVYGTKHTEPIFVGMIIPVFNFVDRDGNPVTDEMFPCDWEFDPSLTPTASVTNTGTSVALTPEAIDYLLNIQNVYATEEDEPRANNEGQTHMDIQQNMMAAVENGGPYGSKDYGSVHAKDLEAERTVTIGWWSMYGNNARDYLIELRERDPAMFDSIDTTGEIREMFTHDWHAERYHPSESVMMQMRQLATTTVGMELQDERCARWVVNYWQNCVNKYTDNAGAVMLYTECAMLGGPGAANAIFDRCNGDYSWENIVSVIMNSRLGELAGGDVRQGYINRHNKILAWIIQYVGRDEIIDLDAAATGRGSTKRIGFLDDILRARGIGSMTGDGRKIFLKEILSMSVYGEYYEDPEIEENYNKYCFDILDFAVVDWDGLVVDYTIVDSGDTVEWWCEYDDLDYAPEKMLLCTVIVPVCTDLYILELNDKNFVTTAVTVYGGTETLPEEELIPNWNLSNTERGDLDPFSYMCMQEKEFERIFNVDLMHFAHLQDNGTGKRSGVRPGHDPDNPGGGGQTGARRVFDGEIREGDITEVAMQVCQNIIDDPHPEGDNLYYHGNNDGNATWYVIEYNGVRVSYPPHCAGVASAIANIMTGRNDLPQGSWFYTHDAVPYATNILREVDDGLMQLQPGDMFAYDGHVDIVVKVTEDTVYWANAGSDNGIAATARDGYQYSCSTETQHPISKAESWYGKTVKAIWRPLTASQIAASRDGNAED